jgi:hypothetical protein
MPTFQIDRDVINANGTQSFQCEADSIEEAYEKFKHGDDRMVSSDVEVTELSRITSQEIYIADDKLEEM